MKTFIGPSLGAAILLAFLFGLAPRVEPSEAAARSCYSIWAEAQSNGSHFIHRVYVENDCEYWMQCTVWTNYNIQPPRMLSVAPGMTENAEITGEAQYDDPKAFGSCRRQ